MGFEMLVNALLKAMGYTRADLDAAVEKGKTTIEQAKIDIASFDNRLTRIESALSGILAQLDEIAKKE